MAYIESDYEPSYWSEDARATGPLEREARVKMGWFHSLEQLRNQIRRTDVEMRHLTGDKSMKEFETDLLRTLTLTRQLQTALFVVNILESAENPLAAGTLIYAALMGGMVAATSAATMSELG